MLRYKISFVFSRLICLIILPSIDLHSSAFASEVKPTASSTTIKEMIANNYEITLKYSIFGLGAEAWYKLRNSDQVGYKIDIDTSVASGAITAAYFYRHYFWRKIYIQTGAGLIYESSDRYRNYGPGIDFVLGNDFYKTRIGIIGIDWIGLESEFLKMFQIRI